MGIMRVPLFQSLADSVLYAAGCIEVRFSDLQMEVVRKTFGSEVPTDTSPRQESKVAGAAPR